MKKIFLIIILILGITILSGCGDKENFEFEFENFYGYFYTENTFEEENQEFTGFAYNLLSNKMIKVYKQKQNSGYIDSIIILKQNTTKDLLSFVEENQEKMKLDGYDFENQKEYETRCKDKKLKSIVISSILNGNLKNIYFTQAFIKNKDYVYIISFSSDKEDERDIFESDVKSIKCR
ncbi:MAG TPA: hypothetical protein VJ892_02650 [Candidatus Absconditabacterales bacterium]|nr:hypothetical protein [Candidatus Absconditabacterales bacterium]